MEIEFERILFSYDDVNDWYYNEHPGSETTNTCGCIDSQFSEFLFKIIRGSNRFGHKTSHTNRSSPVIQR